MSAATTVAVALRQATVALTGSDSSRLDAELLLAHVLGVERTVLFRAPERVLTAIEQQRFDTLVAARARGTPIAYLRGQAEFWSMTFEITPAVLVPRADTERLVEIALELGQQTGTWIDLGTGSGAIALALARERPDAFVVATDNSPAALTIAARNVARHALTNICLVQGCWTQPLAPGVADLIAANPPYIGLDERAGLGLELSHEPERALYAGEHGLAELHAIADHAVVTLKRGGWLVLEHGAEQAPAVARRLRRNGYVDIVTHHDLGGQARVTCGRRV